MRTEVLEGVSSDLTFDKGYKQTELGLIPSDWEIKSLGDVGEVKMCRRVFNEQTNGFGPIPFYKIGTFGREPDAFISQELYDLYRQKYSFPNVGDILISAAGTIGRTIVYNGDDAYFQDSNIVWIENGKSLISNSYLFYVLQVAQYNTEGGTIQRLYNSILKNTKFLCPPKSEQTAIATALADADALIRSLEKLIEKKKKIKQGAMQELLRPKEGWVRRKLGEIGEIITGNTPPTANSDYWNGSYPWITPTDIDKFKDIYHSEREISQEGLKVCRKLPSNTLLVTCIASIGKNAVLRSIGACNQQINAIIPNHENDVNFLYYLIENNKPYLLSKAGITATLIISKKEFSEITFLFPNREIQMEIAKKLNDMDVEISSFELKLEKYSRIKLGMMQNLLTGKIRLI